METYNNIVLERLPRHLKRYVVAQRYERYTALDQALWRYVMRQNYSFLKDVAYYPYIPGLKKAGLSIAKIPDLQQMNDSLKLIGWGAVTVDGFIPPAAFMEFQAHRVLVIAADIRQLEHIEYTPAPDIIHESSGHAPIIGEPDYASYLQYFGEIGTKALSSGKDFELYEAIRHLSILKENPTTTQAELSAAEEYLQIVQDNMGAPSEMALLSRLHWWTVEYGLIGNLKDPKIYGAGLLSSIGESASCMREDVPKLPYDLKAIDYAYDITKPQPQLFVTPDFEHLKLVLDFDEAILLDYGIVLGKECVLRFDSGIIVEGIVQRVLRQFDKIVLISFTSCEVYRNNREEIYFKPEWGTYDMAVGSEIVSVFAGAADKDAFEPIEEQLDQTLTPLPNEKEDVKLIGIHALIRELREQEFDQILWFDSFDRLSDECIDHWLALVELYEIAWANKEHGLAIKAESKLLKIVSLYPTVKKPVGDGIRVAKEESLNNH
ncbi:aromatic amino acid hydroxylase [Sphingobacterium sp.]|uniref:aromatic amino acid hydroxylase n=1 Tax=Sphingobacterium sp. TaxID=341027 RepID=UPI0028A2DCE5|nr:aromatic amino acid hydroxylase [Sphingobacterium sp.]